MSGPASRLPAAIALVGSLLGLIFATVSTLDYAAHLDRGLHNVACSFIPGVTGGPEAEGCRAAMYSPYAALLREQLWGGVPISLFAVGAFSFFSGFSLYLLFAGKSSPKKAVVFLSLFGLTPLLVSLLMLGISLLALGTLCKTCAGIYAASFLLAIGSLAGLATLRDGGARSLPEARDMANAPSRPVISLLFPVAWLAALGVITLIPAAVYASSVPDHTPYLGKCGEIQKEAKESDGLLRYRTERSVRKALMFEDPLCPTCKAFHQRIKGEGIWPRLDVELALFPLDSECNWMLDAPLHPGACTLSKAVLCGKEQSLAVLEWSYREQEALAAAGKAGDAVLRGKLSQRWGAPMLECLDHRDTKARLNRHLQFAVDNSIPVSTPQLILGKQRICDEDTDIGLRFALGKLAPEVLR
jgi:uncharacterized membrane protein